MDSGNGRTQRKLYRRSNLTSSCIWEEAEAQGVKPLPRAIQLETETRFENPGLSLLPRALPMMTEWQIWAPLCAPDPALQSWFHVPAVKSIPLHQSPVFEYVLLRLSDPFSSSCSAGLVPVVVKPLMGVGFFHLKFPSEKCQLFLWHFGGFLTVWYLL